MYLKGEDSDTIDLLEKQDNDRDIAIVKSWEQSTKRPDYKAISSKNYTVKSLWAQWNRLRIKEDLLCRI